MMNTTMTEKPFKSFLMGGFEGADHINARQMQLDMVEGSGHLYHFKDDYKQLKLHNINTVRESVGWRISQPTKKDKLDLSRMISFAKEAKSQNVQVVWTFMHYGTPTGISILDDSFIEYFVEYAKQVAAALEPHTIGAPVFNLINEISFLAWASSQTDYMWPYRGNNDGANTEAAHEGFRTKCRLVKAVIESIKAIKKIIPHARFIHIEPILHIVAPVDRPDLQHMADEIRNYQWQTWELIKGNMHPELGGKPEYLDLMGVNYYYNGQLEIISDKHLEWEKPDARRLPFSCLLIEAYQRYTRPLIISETGHVGTGREQWLREILHETDTALSQGVDLQGLCIYPILDRPCWHEPEKMIRCGLLEITDTGRTQNAGYLNALKDWKNLTKG